LASVTARVDQDQAAETLYSFMKIAKGIPNAPCSCARSLVSDLTLPAIIDLLKWPTCTRSQRDTLLERIGELEGNRDLVGVVGVSGQFTADLWRFVAWAKKQPADISGILNTPPVESPTF
jgi:hypothetical protein